MDGHKPLCAAAMGSSTASTAWAISRAGVRAESTGAAWRIKPGFRCRQSGRVGGSSANALSHQSSSSVSIQRIVSASDAPSLRKQSTARGTKRTESVLRPRNPAVSAACVINDTEHLVQVVVDQDLRGCPRFGMHPNDNTASVWLPFDQVERLFAAAGHTPLFVSID